MQTWPLSAPDSRDLEAWGQWKRWNHTWRPLGSRGVVSDSALSAFPQTQATEDEWPLTGRCSHPPISHTHSSTFSHPHWHRLCSALRMCRRARPSCHGVCRAGGRTSCILTVQTEQVFWFPLPQKGEAGYTAQWTTSVTDVIKTILLYFREALIPSTLYLPACL